MECVAVHSVGDTKDAAKEPRPREREQPACCGTDDKVLSLFMEITPPKKTQMH